MKAIKILSSSVRNFANEDSLYLAWKKATSELPEGCTLDSLDNCMILNGWRPKDLEQLTTTYSDVEDLIAELDLRSSMGVESVEDGFSTDCLKAFLYDYFGIRYEDVKTQPITLVCPRCGHTATTDWSPTTMGTNAFCPACGMSITLVHDSQDGPSAPPTLEEPVMVRTPVGAIIVRPDISGCKSGIRVDFRRADDEPETPLAEIAFFSTSSDFLEFNQGFLRVTIGADKEAAASFDWKKDRFRRWTTSVEENNE